MVTFNDWFSTNYDKIKQRFSLSVWFNEDCFHDAYLSALETSKEMYAFRNCNEKEIDKICLSLFNAAYKAQSKTHYSGIVRNIHPTNYVWGVLTANLIDEDDVSNTNDKSKLIASIRQFAKRTFNKDDYALFEAYFVHSFGLQNSGEFCGKSTSWAFVHVAHIREMICKQFEDELSNLK